MSDDDDAASRAAAAEAEAEALEMAEMMALASADDDAAEMAEMAEMAAEAGAAPQPPASDGPAERSWVSKARSGRALRMGTLAQSSEGDQGQEVASGRRARRSSSQHTRGGEAVAALEQRVKKPAPPRPTPSASTEVRVPRRKVLAESRTVIKSIQAKNALGACGQPEMGRLE